MSVIAGNGAQEFICFVFAPGTVSAGYSKKHTAGKVVKHKVKAGISANDNFIGANTQNIAKKLFCFLKAVNYAVIAAICAVFAETIVVLAYNVKQLL